jgi:starch synthase
MRELRREGCGALICQEYEYARFDACVLLGRRMGIPVFATFQGGKRLWGTLQRFARPIALRHCAGLIIGPRQEIQRVQAH